MISTMNRTRLMVKDINEQPKKGKYILVVQEALGSKVAVWIDNWAIMPGVVIFLRNGETVAEQSKNGVPVAALPLNESVSWAVLDASYFDLITQTALEDKKMEDGREFLTYLEGKFGKNRGKIVVLPEGTQVVVPMTPEETKECEKNEKDTGNYGVYR